MKYGWLLGLAACAAHVDPAQVDAVLALSGDPEAGATVFDDECVECHDDDGLGIKAAPLPEALAEDTDEELVERILAGPWIMPNFVNKLEDQEVADVLAHLRATWP